MPKTFTTLRLSQQLKHYNDLDKGSQYDRFVLAVFLMTNVYNMPIVGIGWLIGMGILPV
ncbi:MULTISPECIES: hypothetical protein [Bacillus]|uniref:hypothetical protein n=1 Tax=Bacillus safensis TaxID=561879 RepID=UPI001593372E|nr:hypothetical protein [Bacillus safensis]MCY7494833.1 hypothetical protein [Bacillus safensis]MED4992123.1 hypothetical protein [Bacillus safensis]UDB45853.1 hypothetical protein B0X07_10300 [Bacillus safensis]